MMSYKDMTFCGSKVEKHTCDRELSIEDAENAISLEMYVSYAEFCKPTKK